MDVWRGLRNIGGLSYLLRQAYLLLGITHFLPQNFDGFAALGMPDRITYRLALKGVRVTDRLRFQQIEAVLLPVRKEELHAFSIFSERHTPLHIVGEQGVVDFEEGEVIVSLDLILVGLEEDVTEPHPPEMGLEQSEQVHLVALTRLPVDAFQLHKVAAADAEFLVY